jgi:hypothetical protein
MMKVFKNFLATGTLFLGMIFTLAGCGKDNSSDTNAAATAANTCGCPVGQVYTQMGCATQSSCPAGQGFIAGGCYPTAACNNTTAGYPNTNNGYPNTGYPNNGYPNQNACTIPGQAMTQMGCGTIQNCPANSNTAMVNGTCQPIVQNGNPNGGFPNNGNPNTGYPNNGYPYNGQNGGSMNCGPGMIATVVGCLSRGPCNIGQVYFQNQCFNLVYR